MFTLTTDKLDGKAPPLALLGVLDHYHSILKPGGSIVVDAIEGFDLVSQAANMSGRGTALPYLKHGGALPAGVRMDGGFGGDGRSPSRGVKFFLDSPNDAATATATLELRVPRGARVWVKSGTADIDARDVTGGLDLNVIGGKVTVNASPRELQIEAMDAAVTIDGTPEWLRAKTASGDITLRGGSNDLGLTSVSGALRVEGGSVARARLETVTGDITFAALTSAAGALDVDSHSGTVDLALTEKSGFTLNASSITGTIENRFDKTRPSTGREGRGAELGIDAGNASARITVRTFRGKIVVHR